MDQPKIQYILRLPLDLREWLINRSDKDCRSVNMQIVYFLNQIKNNEEKIVENEN